MSDRLERLELDIDLRISGLWQTMDERQREFDTELVATLMRAAYGQGYQDALREAQRGALCSDHGYPIPERRCS